MAKFFIFLEITDPEINALIWAITEIVTGQRPTQPFHMTVRGPYEEPISKLESFQDIMKDDVLEIGQVGRFSNPNEETVYFPVNSPNLRRIWWKPDFSIGKFGFNPHISLYRGRDREFANRIKEISREGEDKSVMCRIPFGSHVTKQLDLFPLRFPSPTSFLACLIQGVYIRVF
ncbi:MAG: hypothetical protein ACREV3_06885 [Gammaproteobacteria bacterium]